MTSDVSLLTCFDFRFEPRWYLDYHYHEFHEMILVMDGMLCVELDTSTCMISPGQLITLPQETHHKSSVYGESQLHFIAMGWKGGKNLAYLEYPVVSTDINGRVHQQMTWIMDYYPRRFQEHVHLLNALAFTIMHEIGMLQAQPTSDIVVQVCNHVRFNLHRRITLEDLANLTCMSKYHFARTFKHLTDQTPMQMVNQMRLEVAHDLILQTDLPIQDIALQVGLVDASHLTRLFRKHYDCTPGSLRHSPRRNTFAIVQRP